MILDVDAELNTCLDDLFELDGVIAAMICSNAAQPLAAKMPSVFDELSVSKLSKKFAQILASIKELKMKQDIITFSYDEGSVILKDLKRGFLLIFCSINELNPLMEMSFNMTSKRLIRYLSFGNKNKTVNKEKIENEKVDLVEDSDLTIDPDKIRELKVELSKYIGPVAAMAIKKKAKKLHLKTWIINKLK